MFGCVKSQVGSNWHLRFELVRRQKVSLELIRCFSFLTPVPTWWFWGVCVTLVYHNTVVQSEPVWLAGGGGHAGSIKGAEVSLQVLRLIREEVILVYVILIVVLVPLGNVLFVVLVVVLRLLAALASVVVIVRFSRVRCRRQF